MAFRNPFRRQPAARVAAAQPLEPGWNRTARKLEQQWQRRATYLSTELGVIRFASGLKADAGARCPLTVEVQVDPRGDVWEPATESEPIDALAAYRGEEQSQRELVRQHIWLYDTVGEAIQLTDPTTGRLRFEIRHPFSLHWKHDVVLIMDVPNGTVRDGTARELPIEYARRLWVADETYPKLATSPLRGVLRDCERYWSLQRRMQRTVDSALGMGSIIWTPERAHTALPAGKRDPDTNAPGTWLERDYYKVAGRKFEDHDDENVESVSPTMWHWDADPAQGGGPPVKVDLSQPFDGEAIVWRLEALESIARGLNYPQRLLVDNGDSMNHWGTWLLEEQFVKNAIAPVMERVCWDDLTASFLRPALRQLIAKGIWSGNPDRYRVGFDATPIIVHPDQSKIALELEGRGLIGDTKALGYAGFKSTDAPTREELGRWILREQILRQRISAQTTSDVPSDAPSVIEQIPQSGPPALAAASRVAATTFLGPRDTELVGWLD